MSKRTIHALVASNVLAAGLVVWSLVPSGHADAGLQRSDLVYGRIDVDGDGEYTSGDDWFVSFALREFPDHIDNALKSATRRADGGIDLSEHLQKVSRDEFERARRAVGE